MIRILTDCARNHYVIKTADNWNEDKAGVKFSEYIVKPLLAHIADLMDKYHEKISKINMKTGKTSNEILDHMTKLYNCVTFIKSLTNNIFVQPILKELAPYLRYLSSELNLDDENENEKSDAESDVESDVDSDIDNEKIEKLEELKLIQEDLINIVKNNNSDNSADSDNLDNLDNLDNFDKSKSKKSVKNKNSKKNVKSKKIINSEDSSESKKSEKSEESDDSKNNTSVYKTKTGKILKFYH